MTQLLDTALDAKGAVEAATTAAASAGCQVRELKTVDELQEMTGLFSQVWAKANGQQIVPAEMARALAHAGNYAAGVFVDGALAGAALGFLGQEGGCVHLHSHIMGALPPVRSRGLGFALKLHQRAWALHQGVQEIRWTFDPLVRRNAYFNLAKLGAEAGAYYADFYGKMADEINAGDDSDRVLVNWRLDSPRVVACCAGDQQTPDEQRLRADGAVVVLDEDGDERPVMTLENEPGPRLLCRVPRDIVSLRRRDPRLAREWRSAVRETLGRAMADGHRATSVTRTGLYVLERVH